MKKVFLILFFVLSIFNYCYSKEHNYIKIQHIGNTDFFFHIILISTEKIFIPDSDSYWTVNIVTDSKGYHIIDSFIQRNRNYYFSVNMLDSIIKSTYFFQGMSLAFKKGDKTINEYFVPTKETCIEYLDKLITCIRRIKSSALLTKELVQFESTM